MSSRSIFVLLLLFAFPAIVLAQRENKGSDDPEEKKLIYKKQFLGGAMLHSNGWGFNAYQGYNITAKKKRRIGLEFAYMKHPKEFKSYNPYYEDARGYIYGKRNEFMILRPTYGVKKVMFQKLRKSGVEVSYHWGVGPSLGLTKPVYLEIGYPDVPYDRIVQEQYDPDRHFIDNIYGKAPWSQGLGKMRLYPGLFGRFGLHFDYAAEEDRVQAIETGVSLDGYFQRVPIMAFDEGNEDLSNKQFFFSLYLCIHYGKKFYR